MTDTENQNMDKVLHLQQLLENAQDNLAQARNIIKELGVLPAVVNFESKVQEVGRVADEGKSKIIEGVFDGENMVGPDGKIYTIPPNYVSKSKLVEGDIMKLTILPDGSFVYKQIGPVKRKRRIGVLVKDETTGEFRVMVGQRSYKVIRAAVTYFKGDSNDEAVILTPEDDSSQCAAVENIIKVGTSAKKRKLLTSGEAGELTAGDDSLLNNSILENID